MRLKILRSSTQYIYTFCMDLKQPFFPYTALTCWFELRQRLLRGTDWIFNSAQFQCFSLAIAQAVSRRPLTAEAQFLSQASSREICVGRSGTGTGFSPRTSVFRWQFYSIHAPY